MRPAALVFGALISTALSGFASGAHAFEREWHIGAAAGVAGGHGLSLSPALGAYAAYGISDVFDVRLELTARDYPLGNSGRPSALSTAAGLAYKIDVLRWVPWVGVYAGGLWLLSSAPSDLAWPKRELLLGAGAGLDYAFSRHFGAGATFRYDDALTQGNSSFEALLRAEYRWGW